MIDPMTSLAFSVHSNKGVYALLLGSGISTASGIPTGSAVTLDLIQKVAVLAGEDCEPDHEAWFRAKYNTEPSYSTLMNLLGKTAAERQQLLRGYFEPTEEERAQGQKLPNAAHKTIAELVQRGYIRVILMTNFDRLLEIALEDVGVPPAVISSPEQVTGALPLAHTRVTVVKVNGDYLDTRIKNTESELATYDPPLNALLDRIFDEYGLIVVGWSADWDTALRSAVERCPSRRFTTFWTTRSDLGEQAKRIVAHRGAQLIRIKDANRFFERLNENLRALADMSTRHPLTPKMAAATVKRYVVDPAARVRLHDLVYDETEIAFARFQDRAFSASELLLQWPDELRTRVGKYDALCETLTSILIAGCFWGGPEHAQFWVNCLQRIANHPDVTGNFYERLLRLKRYPALRLMYAGGLAAIASENYGTLKSLLTGGRILDGGREHVFCTQVCPPAVIEKQIAQLLSGLERHHTPVSDHLNKQLRAALHGFLASEEQFQAAFDRFEYLLALVYVDLTRQDEASNGWWGPVGRFHWRKISYFPEEDIGGRVAKELDSQGSSWAPLKAGLFDGELERAKQAKTKYSAFLRSVHYW